MSLAAFKSHLKFASIVILILLYGIVSYQIGKLSPLENFKFKPSKNESRSANKIIERPVESSAPFNSTQTSQVISSYVKLCSNTAYGLEFAYPKDWFTTYNTEQEKCTFFAPFTFVLPNDTSNFTIPIKLEVVSASDWQETVKFYQNPNDFLNILSVENLEVGGRSVQKVKATTTQTGGIQPGLAKITYLVYDTKTPVVFNYQQLDKNENTKDFEDNLYQMVNSLRVF